MERRSDWARNITTGAPAGLATISVKNHGTNVTTPLFSDDGVTPRANPFTAAGTTGIYAWYAANGRYDETVTPVSGEGAAYTNSDLLLYDPTD